MEILTKNPRLQRLDPSHPKGYFLFLAQSRSGHNFVRFNLLSWLENEGVEWQYSNLENHKVNKDRFADYTENVDFSIYPNSVFAMNVRGLSNWYSSIFYFYQRGVDFTENNKEDLSKKQFMDKKIFDKAYIKFPKLIEDPNLVILDGITKERYLENNSHHPKDREKRIKRQINSWLLYAKEIKGETNEFPGFAKIVYDEFVKSREYRKKICAEIGGTYNESKLNYVPHAGNGSTFDGKNYLDRGSQMKTRERWRQWKPEHYNYLRLLKEHEAWDFYINNFEVTDEEVEFIENI